MDSFELNKILGAILGTLLFVMGLGFVAEAIYAPRASGAGYALPGASEEANPSGPAAPAAVADIGTLLAKADPKAGESAAKKCGACHDFNENGPNKIGPNLYGVVGRAIASHPGFAYSEDLGKHKSEAWTYDTLNLWLLGPKAFAPGTKMGYAGDKDDVDRANIIAYLATLSHSPVPFPAPAAPGSAEPASAASEAPAAAASTAASDASAASATSSAASEVSAASTAASAASEAPASSASAASSSAP